MPTLAERVRRFRSERGLKQAQLAEAAGINLSLVTKIEQGVVTNPTLATLQALAAALGVSVGDLVD